MNTTMAQCLAWIYSRTATVVPSHLEAIVSYLRPCQHFEALRTAISRSQQHQHCVLHRGSTLHILVTGLNNSNSAHLHHYYSVTRQHCQAGAHRHRCAGLCALGHVWVVERERQRERDREREREREREMERESKRERERE